MKFDGTIIITDPCYISADGDWGSIFDYNTNTIKDSHFSTYIWEASGYGDGSCKVEKMKSVTPQMDLEDIVVSLEDSELSEELKNGIKLRSENIGKFCMDSGCFCVCYLEEALKYNPKILTDYGQWCFTVIEDFIGDIEVFRTDAGEEIGLCYHPFHLIGAGNKSFYTI